MSAPKTATEVEYPLSFSINYPEKLDRLSSAFRIFWAVPILILVGLVSHGQFSAGGERAAAVAGGGGILFLPVLLMLLFRRKYPAWWFDWNLQMTRFSARVGAYLLLLRDEYPATDDEQAVHLDIEKPNAGALNRWLPLVKWFLAIPHWLILFFLWIGVVVVTGIAWFAILFTGRYPEGMHGFVVGVGRWGYRVVGYALLLTTDQYPPFSLD